MEGYSNKIVNFSKILCKTMQRKPSDDENNARVFALDNLNNASVAKKRPAASQPAITLILLEVLFLDLGVCMRFL